MTLGAEAPIVVLTELPETPTGWTKSSVLHLNFGRGKGASAYAIHDEQGRKVARIGYAYNTAEQVRGFTLDGEGYFSWAELREAYGKPS